MRARLIILVVLAALTAALAVRVWRLERDTDAAYADVSEALEQRNRLLQEALKDARAHQRHTEANLELAAALFACNQDQESAASVERDPCRLVCWDTSDEETIHYTEPLSEAVCGSLP